MSDRAAVEVDSVSLVVTDRSGDSGRNRNSVPVRFTILRDVSFDVNAGEIVGLVGPSGCGKTTLLNMIAGLVSPTSGAVRRLGDTVEGPHERVGYMFARDGLMPWRTALRNVVIGLEVRRVPRREARERAMHWLEVVRLQDFAHWHPYRLSQGMRQRVALCRTLATEPDILLMDEPFAALDVQTKQRLQSEFLDICAGLGKAVLWVTHDVSEAVALGDRVIVMNTRPGTVDEEVDVPFPHPRELDALRFNSDFVGLCHSIWQRFPEEVRGSSPHEGPPNEGRGTR